MNTILLFLVVIASCNCSSVTDLESRLQTLEQAVFETSDHVPDTANVTTSEGVRELTAPGLRNTRYISNVAFSARLSQRHYHLTIGTKIVCDDALLNDGNAYNPANGIFTAPHSGVYMFIYNFGRAPDPGQTWIHLMKDGVAVNAGFVENNEQNDNLQGGNAAIIRVSAGSRVWLETYWSDEASIYALVTTFTGVLLY